MSDCWTIGLSSAANVGRSEFELDGKRLRFVRWLIRHGWLSDAVPNCRQEHLIGH